MKRITFKPVTTTGLVVLHLAVLVFTGVIAVIVFRLT